MRHVGRLFLCLGLAVASVACDGPGGPGGGDPDAVMAEISVTPEATCAGRPVTVTWDLGLPYGPEWCCPAPGACSADSDCPGELECRSVEGGSKVCTGGECPVGSHECPGGYVCVDGVCTPQLPEYACPGDFSCVDNADCPDGLTCQSRKCCSDSPGCALRDAGGCKPGFHVSLMVDGEEVSTLEDFIADGTADGDIDRFLIDPGPEEDAVVSLSAYYLDTSALDARNPVAREVPLEAEVSVEIREGWEEGIRPIEPLVFPLACDASSGTPVYSWMVQVESAHYVSEIRNANEFSVEVLKGETDEGSGVMVPAAEGGESGSVEVFEAHHGTWWLKLLPGTEFDFPGCPIPSDDTREIELELVLKCLCHAESGCTAGSAGCCCGDGFLDTNEVCDPPDDEGCSNSCQLGAFCGNGVIEEGEECDPPDGFTCGTVCVDVDDPETCLACQRLDDSPSPPPSGGDGFGCTTDCDCDDGVYCNGAEQCVTYLLSTSFCVSGTPCPSDCIEGTDQCPDWPDRLPPCEDGG